MPAVSKINATFHSINDTVNVSLWRSVFLDVQSQKNSWSVVRSGRISNSSVYEIRNTLRNSNPQEFLGLILRLGGFYFLRNYLGAVGKVMTGTGLKEKLVKVATFGWNCKKIISGRGLYQSINAHMRKFKIMVCYGCPISKIFFCRNI